MKPSDEATRRLDETRVTSPIGDGSAPGTTSAKGVPSIPDVEIERELGRGGMGVVYQGRQPYIDRRVAVKVLLSQAAGEEYVKRFHREATLLAQLSHPHIVACHSAGVTTDGSCYLVMEFVDGPNLLQHIKAKGPLTPLAVLRVIREIAAALRFAQTREIIHRDVKAENILLCPGGGDVGFPFSAKLVDLGLARPVRATGDLALTQQGLLLGTPSTMAPEQFDDPEGVDHRADIYGLGCAAFQALTGTTAFSGRSLVELITAKTTGPIPDPARLRPGLPAGISDLIRSMLARDRGDRPQSYDELIARCERSERTLAVSRPASRRWPMVVLGSGLAAVVVMGVLLIAPAKEAAIITPSVPGVPASGAPPVVVEAPPPIIPVEPRSWSSPVALFGTGFTDALSAWQTRPGWGLALEGEGIIGTTADASRITHALPSGGWKLTGSIDVGEVDRPFAEAGLAILLPDGSSIEGSIKFLGSTSLAGLSRRTTPEGRPDPITAKGVSATGPWEVIATAEGGQLRVAIGGIEFPAQPLPAEGSALALTVKGGAARFSQFALAPGGH